MKYLQFLKYLLVIITVNTSWKGECVSISKVTIFQDRAYVLRQLEKILDPGIHQLEFDNIPDTVNLDEVKVTVNQIENFEILGIGQEAILLAKYGNEKLNNLISQEKKIQQEIDNIFLEGDKIIKQDNNLQRLLQHYKESFAWNLNNAIWTADSFFKFMTLITSQNNKLYKIWGDLAVQLRAKQKQKDDISAQIITLRQDSQKSYLKIKVAIKAVAKGKLILGLQYLVTAVQWSPIYDLRASTRSSTAAIEMFARITQNTGENWENVQLMINQNPAPLKTSVPQLAPNYLGYQEVEAVQTSADNIMEDNVSIDAGKEDYLGESGESSLVLELPGLHTIKSNGASSRVLLGKKSLSYQEILELNGQHQNYVYHLGDFKNPFAFGLLAGKWSVYLDQQLVNQTSLPYIPVGKNFYLNLGIEYGIYVQRQVFDHSKEQGMIEKEVLNQRDINFKIKNNTSFPQSIRVLEQVPISQLQKVKVSWEESLAKFLPLPDFEGWYYSQLEVPKGGEQSFAFKVKVVAPSNFQFQFP